MEKPFDVRGYVNAWNTHNLERVAEFYAPDAEILAPPNPETYRGKEGARRLARETLEGIPDLNGDVTMTLRDANRVALYIHVSGRHTGRLKLSEEQVLEPTGKAVRFDLADFLELDDAGKIRREIQLADVASLLMQVGVLGAEAPPEERRAPPRGR